MLNGQGTLINGDGKQERDFVYVGDCARANLLALTMPNEGAIYNLGSGYGTSVNDIFRHLKRITGYQLDAVYGPAKVGETRQIYLKVDRARQELDWMPSVALDDGLARTVEYFRTTERVS
jgi:UDP-glucose 4-epimerase